MNTKQYLKATVTVEKGTGKFAMIASTATVDRQGEVIDQNGWDLSNYLKNPVILWAHDYSALPIGVSEETKVEAVGLTIRGRFASPEANPMAENVRLLYEEGICRTVSVGFIPKEWNGNVITKAELLEVSFVPVPANPQALALAMSKGMKVEPALVELIDKCAEVDITEPTPTPEPPVETPAPEVIPEIVPAPEITPEPTPAPEQKAGRELSTKNRELIATAISNMKSSIASLEELLTATTPPEKSKSVEDIIELVLY